MKNALESMSKKELIKQLFDVQNAIQKLESSNQQLESSNREKDDEISKKNDEISKKDDEISKKNDEISKKNDTISKKSDDISRLQLIVVNLQRMLFGSKRERFESPTPGQLLIEFEEFASPEELVDETPMKEKISYEREKQKKHAGRNKLPENLEVVEEIIEPDDLTQEMVKIGEERTEILEYTPAKFFKRVIVRPKYIDKQTKEIKIAELPSRSIEKCLAGNSVLTQVLVSKYVDHLPLYRQQQIFKRADIEIAPSTIDSWVARTGNLLELLYDRMRETVKNQPYLQADETTLKVLDANKKAETHLGYLWAYHAPVAKIMVFDYQTGRSADAARNMLSGFHGTLQTDGYKVYDQFCLNENVTHLACWAHARRYFEKALAQDKKRAEYVLTKIQKIYAIERKIKDLSSEEKKEIRLNEALPIINEIGAYLHAQRNAVLPKSLIGKAIEYTTKLWSSLMNYLNDGDFHIDNNAIENKIRPVALGRKNYLFAGSHDGAKRTAMFYTFFANCKLNNVNPEKWLNAVLDQIADWPVNKLQELFPGKLEV